MEMIFLKVLNMSIAAGWMILAVVLLRFLLKKAPKGFHCILWALVAIRLICPISLESVMSLIPSEETISQETLHSQTPTIDSGVPFINQTMNPVISKYFAPTPGASVNPMQIYSFIGTIVWVAGMIAIFGYAIFSYVRLYRRVKTSVRLQENIWICDNIDSPFILGIIKPKIYLPSDMDESYTAAVLAHENAHIRRCDHWWKTLGFLLLLIHWFNPLVWVAYILLCRDIELACDERVVKEMNVQEKKVYSKALLCCSVSHRMVAACPLAFGEVGIKARIKSVLNYKKPGFWFMTVTVIAGIAFAVCFLTNPSDSEMPEIETIEAAIEKSCGQEADVFALDDSVTGYLFAGYTTDSRVGIAYFTYDEEQKQYVFWGYDENYPEYPFAVTIGEEVELDHSVTIAASSQEEVAFVQMEYEGLQQELGVSVNPVFVVAEWDMLISEQEEMDMEVRFLDDKKEELDFSGPMVPYQQNPDGTWTADGHTYKYRLILRGTTPNAVAESVLTVLTNNLDVTFEDVMNSLFSSHSDDWLDWKETRLVDIE